MRLQGTVILEPDFIRVRQCDSIPACKRVLRSMRTMQCKTYYSPQCQFCSIMTRYAANFSYLPDSTVSLRHLKTVPDAIESEAADFGAFIHQGVPSSVLSGKQVKKRHKDYRDCGRGRVRVTYHYSFQLLIGGQSSRVSGESKNARLEQRGVEFAHVASLGQAD
jgi:hypothetical protein